MSDAPEELPYFEHFTESRETIYEHAGEMLDHIIDANGLKPEPDNPAKISVLTVLGAGWPDIWKDALEEAGKEKSIPVSVRVHAFDNSEMQIKEFRGGWFETHKVSLGGEDGNVQFADLLDDLKPNILFISNIPDKLLYEKVGPLAELIVDELTPEIIMLSCGRDREAAQFHEFTETIERDYKIQEIESADAEFEVPTQAICKLKLE